jgi:hypothetical protein
MSHAHGGVPDGSLGEIRIGMMRHVQQYDPYDAHSEAEQAAITFQYSHHRWAARSNLYSCSV